jgi:hypothetical protein
VGDNEFLVHAQEQLSGDLDSIPMQEEIWGDKLIFIEANSDRRVGALTPHLFPSQALAATFATWLSADESWGPQITEWVTEGAIPMDEGEWMPLFSSAVKLAVVPF